MQITPSAARVVLRDDGLLKAFELDSIALLKATLVWGGCSCIRQLE